MKKTQVIIVSVFGLLVLLVIWTISAMKGKEENQNTVRLSTDNKDVTITDVKAQLERTPLRKQAEGQGGDNPVDIERMRQLIINSEMPPEEEYGRKADTAPISFPHKRTWTVSPVNCGRRKKGNRRKRRWRRRKRQRKPLRQGQDSTRSPCTRAAGGTPSARTCIPTRS